MKILTAQKYRHFIPEASELSFHLPSLAADGSNKLLYQYTIIEHHQLTKQILPSALWGLDDQSVAVYVNGIKQKRIMQRKAPVTWEEFWDIKEAWLIQDKFLYTFYVYLSTSSSQSYGFEDNWTSYGIGDIVLIESTMIFDGWYHLDIRKLLIQGANPANNKILTDNQMFQGGYRVSYVNLNDPVYGQLRRCDTQLGWDYKPPNGYKGMDSFSYQLITEFGQKSEPKCCSIYVG